MTRRTALAILLLGTPALAQGVIEAGREEEVLALFSPYRLGGEIAAGWKLWHVRIGPQAIDLELRGPAATEARLRLTARVGGGESTSSFDVARDVTAERGGGRGAADALVAALRRNDGGGFWKTDTRPATLAPAPGIRGHVAWPLVAGACAILAMWWAGRRKSA